MAVPRGIHRRHRLASVVVSVTWTSSVLASCSTTSATSSRPSADPAVTVSTEDGWTAPPEARLVFQADGRIQTVLAGGSQPAFVNSDAPDGQGHPDWSPKGDRLVFETQFSELWTVRTDGTGLTSVYRCASPCTSVQDGAWSPDGTEIAFVVAESQDGSTTSRSAILALDVASGGVRTIHEDTSGLIWLFNPRWSGDGQSIVFEEDTFASDLLSETEIASAAVATVSTTGQGAPTTLVTIDGPFAGPGAPAPDWSPVDDRIVFVRGDNLFTIDVDGTNEAQLTEFDGVQQHAIQPTFTPDGEAIVFTHVTGRFDVDDVANAAVIAIGGSGHAAIGGDLRMTHVRLQP